jgi:hypothetical protein
LVLQHQHQSKKRTHYALVCDVMCSNPALEHFLNMRLGAKGQFVCLTGTCPKTFYIYVCGFSALPTMAFIDSTALVHAELKPCLCCISAFGMQYTPR